MNGQKNISFTLQFPVMVMQFFTHPKLAHAFQCDNLRKDMLFI